MTQVIESKNPTRRSRLSAPRRRAARLAAVQALYQTTLTGCSVAATLEEFHLHRFGEGDEEGLQIRPDTRLFSELVSGASERRAELDAQIEAALAPDWKFERLESLMQAILIAGAYELANRPRVPARVVITEYVEVAHNFYSGAEPGMVNGVLDRLAHSLRPGELEAQSSGPAASKG